jgi:hypothetical protein
MDRRGEELVLLEGLRSLVASEQRRPGREQLLADGAEVVFGSHRPEGSTAIGGCASGRFRRVPPGGLSCSFIGYAKVRKMLQEYRVMLWELGEHVGWRARR